FSGDAYVLDKQFQPAEKSSPWKAFEGIDPTTQAAYGPSVTNYVALSASHVECLFAKRPEGATSAEPPNGVIIPGSGVRDNFPDGMARTLILIESREQKYAAWYDGSVNWCVAYWPDAKNKPHRDPKATPPLPYWTVDEKSPDSAAALDKGPREQK